MRGIKEFLTPKSIEQILDILDKYQDNSVILSGGTHLALVKSSSAEIMIDIKQANLNYIKEDNDNILIGACTRPVDIINNSMLKSFAGGILVAASLKIGSQLTQNLVTIGGNIAIPHLWSNLPPALLVLEAKVTILSKQSSRIVTLQELLTANPKKFLNKNELITSIIIPKSSAGLKTSYNTFSLTENDYDIAIVAVSLLMESGICKKVKIALGSAINPCSTISNAEELLTGKKLSEDIINEAANKSISGLNLVKDFRTTDEHRLEVIKTLVKRSLESFM